MEKNPLKRVLKKFLCSGECDCVGGGPSGDVRVAAVKDVPEDKGLCAEAGGQELAVFRHKGKFYALANACAHMGGPLCQGKVADGQVTCPWHGARFDVTNGDVLAGPAKRGVASFELEVRGEDLFLKGGDPAASGKAAKPVPFAPVFQEKFEAERPFNHQPFFGEVVEGMKFPFKLYGVLPLVVISQSPDEIDLHLGTVHFTEMDMKKVSALMDAVNRKWHTAATFCLYHSDQFPGVMLLNIRGPKAPANLGDAIRFRTA